MHTLRRHVKSEIASDAPTEEMSPSIASVPWILPTMKATMALQESLAALTSLVVSHGSSSLSSASCPPPCDACDPKTRLVAQRPRARKPGRQFYFYARVCPLIRDFSPGFQRRFCCRSRARIFQHTFACHATGKIYRRYLGLVRCSTPGNTSRQEHMSAIQRFCAADARQTAGCLQWQGKD